MSRAVMVGTIALVMAAMMLAMAMPAVAVKGGEKPFTYGDCVSGVAAEGGDVQAVTKTLAPLQSKGTDGKFSIGVPLLGTPIPRTPNGGCTSIPAIKGSGLL